MMKNYRMNSKINLQNLKNRKIQKHKTYKNYLISNNKNMKKIYNN